ncbi:Putative multidrug resistance protein MdtD [Streptomyces microflavus]
MESSPPAARPGGVVGILAFAGIVAALTQTLVVPLIAQLPTLFDTSASNASWVITATLLAAAVSTPVAGRLGDMYGKRRMLLVSLVPLVLGSVVCALSSSVVPMIAGRGLQGLGMGVVPLGISLLRDVVPAEKLGPSIAIMSASMGVGGALGLPFAAAIAENTSWRVLFWVVAALALAVGALIRTLVPADRPAGESGRFDLPGAIGLGSALIALLLAVSKGADWGWGSPTTLALFAAALVLLPAWGWWELRLRDPLVDLRVTARPQVLMTNTASVLVGFAMYAQSLVVPQLLQIPEATGYGLGQSMLAMGLWMAPAGLMMMVMSPVGAKLSAAKGPKVTLAVGTPPHGGHRGGRRRRQGHPLPRLRRPHRPDPRPARDPAGPDPPGSRGRPTPTGPHHTPARTRPRPPRRAPALQARQPPPLPGPGGHRQRQPDAADHYAHWHTTLRTALARIPDLPTPDFTAHALLAGPARTWWDTWPAQKACPASNYVRNSRSSQPAYWARRCAVTEHHPDNAPTYVALCSHTHLFPGARCRLQGLPDPTAFAAAPSPSRSPALLRRRSHRRRTPHGRPDGLRQSQSRRTRPARAHPSTPAPGPSAHAPPQTKRSS